MKKVITICLVATMILEIGSVANAYWAPGMPYKMHYPQLPDPYGWDVAFSNGNQGTNIRLADDWMCTGTGPVNEIQFWISFKNGFTPPANGFVGPDFSVFISSDAPAQGGNPSHPDGDAWGLYVPYGLYDMEFAGTGSQGWFDPLTQQATYPDHTDYYLVNINFANLSYLREPFPQQQGTIYWLGIQAFWPTDAGYEVGWKTSLSPHFGDDAVVESVPPPSLSFQPLTYPSNDPYGRGGQSIDLAFVIAPEPTTICLLALGGLAVMKKRR